MKNPAIVDYAALLLRIALTLMFFAHAWLKIKVFTPVEVGGWVVRIALIGATGFVGSALLKEALDEVTAIVRHPDKLEQLRREPQLVSVASDPVPGPRSTKQLPQLERPLTSALMTSLEDAA